MIEISNIDLSGLSVFSKFFITLFDFYLNFIDNTKMGFTLGFDTV